MPRVLTVDARQPDARNVAEAVRVLRGGGLVAFPTETVYGLGARAFEPDAVRRVFAAKGRPRHHPLIVHVTAEDGGRALASVWPEAASIFARALWPGPLTLVVDRKGTVPSVVAGGGPSIAVRAPAHPVALALIDALGEPIAAPSANRYQQLSPTTAAHVVKQLGGAVDLVLDGGPCEAGIESTVVDVRRWPPVVLRPGAVSIAALRALVPDVVRGSYSVSGDDERAAPGMDARHYAPRARLTLALTDDVWSLALAATRAGTRVGLVVRNALAPEDAPPGVLVRRLSSEATTYARHLYETLHELDDAGVETIVAERVPATDAWVAVADRLERAAASGTQS